MATDRFYDNHDYPISVLITNESEEPPVAYDRTDINTVKIKVFIENTLIKSFAWPSVTGDEVLLVEGDEDNEFIIPFEHEDHDGTYGTVFVEIVINVDDSNFASGNRDFSGELQAGCKYRFKHDSD